jgi:protein-tyrosine phosphatase
MTLPAGLTLASLDVDVHCHLLPAVDDGSRTVAESLEMARALAGLGVRRLHVTPHQFRFGLDWTPEEVARRVADLGAELERGGVSLELVPAGEHMFGERLLTAIERGERLLTWGPDGPGAPAALLVELPLREPVVAVEAVARLLLRRRVRPVMAHPERVESVIADVARVRGWRAAGWEFQLDLLSLAGSYGRGATRTAEWLLGEGIYGWLGSDLHRSSQLPALERAHALLRERLEAAEPAGESARE